MLPRAGGQRDQRAGELDRMFLASWVYQSWKLWKDRQGGHEDEWIERYPAQWKFVKIVMRLRRG